MGKDSIRKFRQALIEANGDKVKMQKAFMGISDYLSSGMSEKRSGQSVRDYLNDNKELKEVHEWAETVLVNDNYQLFNF